MPIVYQIDHEQRLVIAKGRGRFGGKDIFDYQQTVWARPDVLGFDELMDMTEVEHLDIPSTDRMQQLAKLSAGMDSPNTQSKFAIVATNQIAFLLGQMYEAMRGLDERSTKEVSVFHTLDEAMAWLRAQANGSKTESG